MDQNEITATELLLRAADIIDERGKMRDKPSGERSMAHTVKMYNAKYGTNMTESQGWYFMICLKNARMESGAFCDDDYHDHIAYTALHAECALKQQHSGLIAYPEMVRPQAA